MSEKNPGVEAREKLIEAIITFQEATIDRAIRSADQYRENGAMGSDVLDMITQTGVSWKDFVCDVLGVSKEEYDETMRRGGWI